MKKHILLITVVLAALLIAGSASAAGDVRINEKNFPDELFRSYVEFNFDMDGNGILSKEEIKNITCINLQCNDNLKDLKGIEYFSELTELLCSYSSIKKLDVSKNTALVYLACE